MEAAERRLRHLVWAGTWALLAFIGLGLLLPRRASGRASVDRDENGACVLRDSEGQLLLDPWQRPYVYVDPTPDHPRPRVLSLGADGKPGGEGESADIDSDEVLREPR